MNPGPFSHESGALTTELSPSPGVEGRGGGGGGGGSLFLRRQVPLKPRQHPTALSVPPFAWSCAIKSAGCSPVLLFSDPQSSCSPQNSCTSFAVTQPLIGELLAKKGEWAVGVVQIRAKNVRERETGGAGVGWGGGGRIFFFFWMSS